MAGGLEGHRLRDWLGLGCVALASALLVSFGLRVLRASKRTAYSAAATSPTRGTGRARLRHYSEPRLSVHEIEAGDYGALTDSVTQFRPRADVPVYELKVPVDWAADPFSDGNWLFQFHALRMTNVGLAHYEEGSNVAAYREVLAITLDWWRYHRDRDKSKLHWTVWESMTTGVRASHLAYLLDRILSDRVSVSPAEQAELLEMASAHVTRLSDPKALPDSNHGLFQLRGLMLLCRVLGKAGGCKKSRSFLEEHLARLLDKQFSPRGVHREHSPSYHRLAMAALASFADPNGEGVYKDIAERLERARAVWPWFVFPGGRVAALGDSEGEAEVTPPAERQCPAGASAPCAEVGDFTRDGYAIVRSPWSTPPERAFMLIMAGSYNSSTHKHADDLSFELMERGQMLFVDSGKYSYEPDQMRKYVTSVRAHNTVGLAVRELEVGSGQRHATALQPPESADGVYTFSGQVRYRGLFTQERRLEYSPGHYLLINDQLAGEETLGYESYLHLAPGLEPRKAGNALVVALADGRRLRIESLTPSCEAKVERGVRQGKHIQGWVTEGYGKILEASVITFSCAENSASIALLASFDAASRKAALASLAKQAH